MIRLVKDEKTNETHEVHDEYGWIGKWFYIDGELAYMDRFGWIFMKDKMVVDGEQS